MITPEKLCAIWSEYKKFHKEDKRPARSCPKFLCADGFQVSVQVGEYSYGTPRSDEGPWTHAEIGFPSEAIDEWMPWCEDPANPIDAVYGQVPLDVICGVLNARGGVVGAVLWGLS
jgi:hypothetical protein